MSNQPHNLSTPPRPTRAWIAILVNLLLALALAVLGGVWMGIGMPLPHVEAVL